MPQPHEKGSTITLMFQGRKLTQGDRVPLLGLNQPSQVLWQHGREARGPVLATRPQRYLVQGQCAVNSCIPMQTSPAWQAGSVMGMGPKPYEQHMVSPAQQE